MGSVPTFTTGTAPPQADLRWWIASRPLAYCYQSTSQTGVATGAWTPVWLQSHTLDRDGGHVGGSSGRYTIGLTLGKYWVSGLVAFTGAGGSTRQAQVVVNGTAVPGSLGQEPVTGSVTVIAPRVLVTATSVTDYVELQCYHDAGSSLALGVAQGQASQLTIEYAGT